MSNQIESSNPFERGDPFGTFASEVEAIKKGGIGFGIPLLVVYLGETGGLNPWKFKKWLTLAMDYQ